MKVDRTDGKRPLVMESPRPDGGKDVFSDLHECEPIRVGKPPEHYRPGPLAPKHHHVWVDGRFAGLRWCRLCGLLREKSANIASAEIDEVDPDLSHGKG